MSNSKKSKFFKLGPFQREWVDALKSGKYRQTTGKLTEITSSKHKKHCCLGVLCHINRNDLKVIKYTKELSYDEEDCNLPEFVQNKLKFIDTDGTIYLKNLTSKELNEFNIHMEGERVESLIQLNDDFGLNFKEIAYVVETWPQTIFTEPDNFY